MSTEIPTPRKPSAHAVGGVLPAVVVAIHSQGGGAFRFAPVTQFLPATMVWRPISLPGFGGLPDTIKANSLADYANFLESDLADLRKRFPSLPLILLGHGWGGSLALEYVQHYPQGCTALILHAPVGANMAERWYPRLLRSSLTRGMTKTLLASPLLQGYWSRIFFQGPVPAPLKRQFLQAYARSEAQDRVAEMLNPKWWDQLQPRDVPGVLLWGGKDRAVSPEGKAAFKTLVPRLRSVVIPEWDHYPMLESPAHYARVLIDSVQEINKLTSRVQQA